MSKTRAVWLLIFSRAMAGLLGGYGFSYSATAFLAQVLPLPAQDAVIVASLPSFAFYTGAIIWAFSSRNTWSAWAPAALALPLALIGFWPTIWSI